MDFLTYTISPSNLRPFGAPPSIGRREVSTRAPSPLGKVLFVGIVFPHMRVFVLTMREKRYPRFVAFP